MKKPTSSEIFLLVACTGILYAAYYCKNSNNSYVDQATSSINQIIEDRTEINGTTVIVDKDTLDSLNQTRVIKK